MGRKALRFILGNEQYQLIYKHNGQDWDLADSDKADN